MSNKTNDITVIIPVHELNDVTEITLANAVKSVTDQVTIPKLLIVASPTTYKQVTEMTKNVEDCVVIENNGDTDFASQIEFGVANITTKWFSLLEYDDELSSIWIKNVVKYQEAYPEVELFLPIIVDVNPANEFISFTNEAVWANSFSDELGMLDNSALLTYQNFNIDGMVISKEIYEMHGGFKKNIKLTFIYEFLLRMTFKDVKTMVIPKFGYKHVNQREGSLFSTYKEEMDPTESNWWLAQAKKEYYFEKDRAITYQN
jgi:GT2 family glycosyltransferase